MKIEPMSPDEIVRNIRKHMEIYPDQATELVDGLRQVVVERTPDTTPNKKDTIRVTEKQMLIYTFSISGMTFIIGLIVGGILL